MGTSLNSLFVPNSFVKGDEQASCLPPGCAGSCCLGEGRLEREGLESEPDSPVLSF